MMLYFLTFFLGLLVGWIIGILHWELALTRTLSTVAAKLIEDARVQAQEDRW